MRTPVQAQPVARASTAAKPAQGGVNASLCVSANCTANGQCCANVPVIGSFCVANPLPIGGTAQCCVQGLPFNPKVCCSLNGQQIGCFP